MAKKKKATKAEIDLIKKVMDAPLLPMASIALPRVSMPGFIEIVGPFLDPEELGTLKLKKRIR